MATTKRVFRSDRYYHIYNRGVGKQDIFKSSSDYKRFQTTIRYYTFQQSSSLSNQLDKQSKEINCNPRGSGRQRIQLIAYILMPNHFHLLLKPVLQSKDISTFMSDVSNSYTRYFNSKQERSGYLFEGRFKSKEIDSEKSIFQVSRYIHLNPAGSVINLEEYAYSSYSHWIGCGLDNMLDGDLVDSWVDSFGGVGEYAAFVESEIEA